MTMICSARFDDQFGPRVNPCRRKFDFTQLFEESIFGVGLSALFLLFCLFRLWQLRGARPKRTVRLRSTWTFVALAALDILLLVLWAGRRDLHTRATFAAAGLALVSSLVLIPLSDLEHSRCIRPPLLVNAYLLLSILFDIARVRTYWLVGAGGTLTGIYIATLALKVAALAAGSYLQPFGSRNGKASYAREETAGLFGLALWTWLVRFLYYGYKNGLPSLNGLEDIDESLLSSALEGRLPKDWDVNPGRHALFVGILQASRWSIIAPVIPRLAQTFFTYMQPLLLTRSVKYAQAETPSENIGYALIGAYALVYIGYAVTNAQYWRYVNRYTAGIRGILIMSIFAKTADLRATESNNMNSVTLMSTDVERIGQGIKFAHEMWATVVEAAIALYLLERQVGVVSVAPIVILLLCATASSTMAKIAGGRQKLWLEAIQRRLQFTFPILTSTKEIRMLGLIPRLQSMVQDLRITEINIARWYRHVIVGSFAISYATLTISPAVVFGILASPTAGRGRPLDASRVFTALSLINLLATPLITFLQSLPALAAAIANFTRIQEFILADSQSDFRKCLGTTTSSVDESFRNPQAYTAETETEIELREVPKQGIAASTTSVPGDIAISIVNGTISWTLSGNPCLQDINLRASPASLVVVVGPSGSGKSTLLKSILGETAILSGSVAVRTTNIAFADQTPWLANTNVRNNIIGYGDARIDEDFYQEVLRTCALIEDFPSNDHSAMVGSKGSNLSGGQKQRVSIARAAYARAPITLLDDVFSGLDPVTELAVFNGLCGPGGLLRRSGSTIVLATHPARCLGLADHIVVMSKDGRINAQGTLPHLRNCNSYIDQLLAGPAPPQNEKFGQLPGPNDGLFKTGAATSSAASQPRESQASGKSGSVYKYYFRSLGRLNLILFFALAIAFTFTLRFPDIWLSWWADANAIHPYEKTGLYLGVYIGLQMGTLAIIAGWAWASTAFFSTVDQGVTANRFSQDLQLIDSELPGALINATAEILSGIAQLILVAIVSAYICTVYPALAGTLFIVQRFYLKTSQPLRLHDIEAKAPLYTQFMETLDGLVTIRAFGWHRYLQQENKRLLDISQKPFYLLLSIQQWLNLVLNLLVAGLAVVIVGLIIPLRNVIQPAYLGLALSNIMTLGENLRNLIVWWTKLETSIGAVKRIQCFSEETDAEGVHDTSQKPPETWPDKGAVEFNDLMATYDTALTQTCPTLRNINLHVRPGQKVGICGRSGSGKSTLLSTVFRLLELQGGSITIDGLDIATIPLDILRSRLNAIPQAAFLLPGSFRFNIDPWGDVVDDARIWDALDKVQLSTIIRSHGGLDGLIAAATLSHGQRQLFCLARALLRRGKVLILDEVSSSVDNETDWLMQSIIEKEFASHTTLTVAHKLDWIVAADVAVVIKSGQIVEFGSPQELLRKSHGEFRALWDAQHS